jgi:Uma2 family endonuclease
MSQQPTADLSARVITLAEWADMDEDQPGELIDGKIVEEEEVGAEHDIVGAWLIWTLRTWLAARGGFVGMSDTRFGVSRTRGRKPDTYVYLPGRKPPRQGLVTVPPDIMVEIVSPRPSDARRDRVAKMREYAVFGVKFYWIVDPAIRTFEILELGADGRYAHAASASEGTIDPVPGCEGLILDVDALWIEVDRLGPESTDGEA